MRQTKAAIAAFNADYYGPAAAPAPTPNPAVAPRQAAPAGSQNPVPLPNRPRPPTKPPFRPRTGPRPPQNRKNRHSIPMRPSSPAPRGLSVQSRLKRAARWGLYEKHVRVGEYRKAGGDVVRLSHDVKRGVVRVDVS